MFLAVTTLQVTAWILNWKCVPLCLSFYVCQTACLKLDTIILMSVKVRLYLHDFQVKNTVWPNFKIFSYSSQLLLLCNWICGLIRLLKGILLLEKDVLQSIWFQWEMSKNLALVHVTSSHLPVVYLFQLPETITAMNCLNTFLLYWLQSSAQRRQLWRNILRDGNSSKMTSVS